MAGRRAARGVARLRPRIVTTRAERGRLDALLAAGGADVVHVPLIAVEPLVGRAELAERCARADWVAVTSRNGAALVVEAVGENADHLDDVALAAVGRATAEVLERAGRSVAIVPPRQTAADLAAAFPVPVRDEHVVIVQAERPEGDLGAALRHRGYATDEVAGYRTTGRRPTDAELAASAAADVMTFASGSAAASWAALGVPTPSVVAIGPSTARRAAALGLPVVAVADEHSIEGLARIALAVAGLDS